jgi:hypothetical protein
MLQDAKKLKQNLNSLTDEFFSEYYKVIFSGKKLKVGNKLTISYDLPKLFLVIKKYIREIESSRILDGFMKALKQEVKVNDRDGSLFGEDLNKIKNSKTKSYNWAYYSLFKAMLGEASVLASSIQKVLKSADVNSAKKMLENTQKQIKEMEDMEEEAIKLNLDTLLRPKIYKRFLKDFHKSVISWVDAYIMTSEFIDDEKTINKDPLTDTWENIEIRFNDEYNVKLIIDGNEENSDYEKLGFADTRQDSDKKAKYVKSWGVLILFSARNGIIKMSEFAGDKTRKNLFIKSRSDLSKRLQNYFGSSDDPIVYKQDGEKYLIRIKLTPPNDFKDSWQDRNIYEHGKKEYLTNF